MFLDLPTVVILTALSAFLMGVSISLAGLTQSVSDPSLKILGYGCLGQSLGWLLIGFRGRISDALSIFWGNWVLLASALCYLHAVNVFLGASRPSVNRRPVRPWLPMTLWGAGLAVSAGLFFFSFWRPDMASRIMVTSVGHAVLAGICALRLLRGPDINKSRRVVGYGFGMVVVMQVVRVTTLWLDPPRSADQFVAIFSQIAALVFGHIAVVMLSFLFVLMLHDRTARDLRELATLDYLTGIFNRSAFEGYARQSIELARRSDARLSLLLFDIDNFKGINDTLGHMTGDVALRTLTELTKENLRSQDVFGRYGGEEFAVLLPATDAPGAFLVAERIREAVGDHEFRDEATTFRLTISIGIAELSLSGQISTERRLTALFRAADAALYDAKRAGRNRTLIAPPESPESKGDLPIPFAPEGE